MTASIPRQWASNATFSGGAHAGEDTKVDPGSALAANGFYPDLGFAAEHVNHQWSAMSSADRRLLEVAALRPRTLLQFGDAIDDVQECLAAVPLAKRTLVLAANTNGCLHVYDQDRYVLVGAFVTIPVGAAAEAGGLRAAYNGSRVVAVGISGGNSESEYSDDDGATWNDGGQFAAIIFCTWLLWDDVNALFVGLGDSGANLVRTSPDSVTWTGISNVASSVMGGPRLACLAAGPLIGMGGTGVVRISTNTTAWVDGASPIANMAQMTSTADKGCLAGARETFWHVGRVTAGLQVSSSVDGDTWTVTATITPADAGVDDFEAEAPRILEDAATGLLVIACRANNDTLTALFASMDGADWVGPHILPSGYDPDFVAVANGRVFVKRTDMVASSDGIGAD